jgi:hypothetical protein
METKREQGGPHVKARIRKLARELSQRRMMRDGPRATVVVANPILPVSGRRIVTLSDASQKRLYRYQGRQIMSLNRQRWRQKTYAFSALLLASGCLGQSGMPGPAPSSLQARPPGGFGPVGPGGPTPPRPPVGLPGTVTLAGYNQLADYQAADLAQKIEELQDENRSLLARLQGVQGLLEERERAVLLSRGEVQSATQEVAHARQEVTRCRQEIASLREHIRTADKENQTNMQSLVKMLESKLEHGNPPADALVKDQKSEIRGQKSETIDKKPEIRIQNN